LAGLPDPGPFPEDGLKRWETAQASLAEVEDQLKHWSGELARLQEEPVGPIRAPLLEMAGAIRDLWDERVLFREKSQELRDREAAAAGAGVRLADSLAVLGPAWTEARLDDFNPPLTWQAALPQWPHRLEAAAAELRRAEDRAQGWAEKLAEQEGARDRAAAGPFRESRGFLWSFAALGLILVLAAAGVFFFLKQGDLARLLAAGAGMAWLADLAYLVQLRLAQQRRLRELESDLEQTRGAGRLAAESVDQERLRLEAVREEWRRLLGEWSLDPELSPYAALEILRAAGQARGQLLGLGETREVIRALKEYLDGYSRRLAQVLAHGGEGEAPAAPEDIHRTLEHLKAALDESILNQERQQQLAQKSAAAESYRDSWQAKTDRLRRESSRLLQAAEAPDEEEFRRRAALCQRRQELAQNCSRLTAQLHLLAGAPQDLERLETDLEKTALNELKEGLLQARSRLLELEGRLAAAQGERGKTRHRLENLARADDLSRALLTEQTLAARLQSAAHRWAVFILSRHFLEWGRRGFEAEYQPQVLKRASTAFELMTEGRYRRVLAALEGEKFLVVNRDGGHVGAEHLSRGTQEQLYLAMRFALVQEYSQGGRNLPLILDDILVNFDHRRARQAVRLLQEMSRSHQLLLFTCHPHVVDLVREALGPEAPEPITLENRHGGP
jgi:uncharacterized protein YhaN